MHGVHNEDVSGNYINDSKDCQYCFDVKRCEHVKYSAQVIDLKDCYDNNYTEENELCVDYIGSWKNTNCFYSNTIYNCTNVYYSELCYSSKDLFGCAGLRNAQYCIFNKQYSEDEYNELVPSALPTVWARFRDGIALPFVKCQLLRDDFIISIAVIAN